MFKIRLRTRPLAFIGCASLILGLGACFNSPEPACAFACGAANECPDGYRCAGDGQCKRNDIADDFSCPGVTTFDAEVPDAEAGEPDAELPDAAQVDAAPVDADIDAAPVDADIDAAPVDADIDAAPVDADIDAAPMN